MIHFNWSRHLVLPPPLSVLDVPCGPTPRDTTQGLYGGPLNHATTACSSLRRCDRCRRKTIHACDTSRAHFDHERQLCSECKGVTS